MANIYLTDPPYSAGRATENVFFDACETTENFFMTKDAKTNQGFIIDTKCPIIFTKFYLKNTNNQFNNR